MKSFLLLLLVAFGSSLLSGCGEEDDQIESETATEDQQPKFSDPDRKKPTLMAPPPPPPGVIDVTVYSGADLQAVNPDALQEPDLHRQSSKYDDAEWHYETDDFPADAPLDNGYVHIGFYLTWAAERDLLSEFFREETRVALAAVLNRIQSPILLIQIWDGKLVDDMLNDEGNAFSQAQYEAILSDYIRWQEGEGLEPYGVAPTWENYDSLKPVLDRRLKEWRSKR